MILQIERIYPLEIYEESIKEIIKAAHGTEAVKAILSGVHGSSMAYFTTPEIKCPNCGSFILLPGTNRNFGLCMGCDYLYPTNPVLDYASGNPQYIDPITNISCKLRLFIRDPILIGYGHSLSRKLNSHAYMQMEDTSILAIYVQEAIKRQHVNDTTYFVV